MLSMIRNLFDAMMFMIVGATVAIGTMSALFAMQSLGMDPIEMFDEAWYRLTGFCRYMDW